MKSSILVHVLLCGQVLAFTHNKISQLPSSKQEGALRSSNTKNDLENLAQKSNPVLGFYDPLGLADKEFWNQSQDATIGFLRHSEIKHGRVAMAAFVGYCVQSAYTFPWPQTLAGDLPPSADLSPEAQWDAIPLQAKYQIFFVIALLEIWDEYGGGNLDHYMKGRKAGQYPTFDEFTENIHPVFNLYDPFGLNAKMDDAKREKRLVAEINNGRLAMIGIFSVLAADSVPGSVPILASTARNYDGDIMAPFGADFSLEHSTIVGAITTVGALCSFIAGNKSAKRQEEGEALASAPSISNDSDAIDVSIPYDAAAKMAYEASDKSVEYEEFKASYEADAVKMASEKWAKKFGAAKA